MNSRRAAARVPGAHRGRRHCIWLGRLRAAVGRRHPRRTSRRAIECQESAASSGWRDRIDPRAQRRRCRCRR